MEPRTAAKYAVALEFSYPWRLQVLWELSISKGQEVTFTNKNDKILCLYYILNVLSVTICKMKIIPQFKKIFNSLIFLEHLGMFP